MPDSDVEANDRPDDADTARRLGRPLLEALGERVPEAQARADVAVQLAAGIIRALDVEGEEFGSMLEAVRLQEVGKIYLEAAFLAKPLRDLDPDQVVLLDEHYEHGRALARGAGVPRRVCNWILHARERWDGSGPGGLQAAEIPWGSRLIAVTREYIDAPMWAEDANADLTPQEAQGLGVTRLRREAGASLDPELAELAAVLVDPGYAR